MEEPICIDITILATSVKVWNFYNDPRHIVKWNYANSAWHCPLAENDLRVGGTLKLRMEAKDKSFGFDLVGNYDEVEYTKRLKYHLQDGRTVEVQFQAIDDSTTKVILTFDPELENPREMQREGWYSILNNFHKYVEHNT